MSQAFLLVSMWVFSHLPNLVPQFLSWGIAPCVALRLVHLWKEGHSRASLVAILAGDPQRGLQKQVESLKVRLHSKRLFG